MTVTSAIWIIFWNIIAWGFFHFAISDICFRIPLSYFHKDLVWFRIAGWEDKGRVWQRLFLVKKWKKYLIDGSSIVKKSYNKSYLHGMNKHDLAVFAAETKRAELTHWLLMVPAPVFFLWNPIWAGWIMIVYAFFVNFPFIITQRYNRGRIEAIIIR